MAHNRIIAFGVFISLFCLSSCEKESLPQIDNLTEIIDLVKIEPYSPKRLSNMSSFNVELFSGNAQGMDIFEDRILFQAGTGQNYIHIIDLKESKALGTITFVAPNEEKCHMNNINCGIKLNNSDRFPLLYLSQTNAPRSCFVIRISNDAKSYEIVQTIKYIGKNHYLKSSSYDWFVDYSNNFIYSYGHYNGDKDKREIMKFKLPSLDYQEIAFSDDDILDSFVLENQSVYQGSRLIDGLLYTPVGYGGGSYPGRLIIINLTSKEVVQDIPISCGEPEAIGKYKSGAIISSGGKDPTYYYIRF